MDEQAIEQVVQQIRAYLAARPQAADTLEGIHHWWINWAGGEKSPAVTLAALERLVAGGEVEQLVLANRNLWRRAAAAG